MCCIQTPWRPITVCNTHWGLAPWERLLQARALARYLRNTSFPYLLCGDLNDHPASLAIRVLLEKTPLQDSAVLSSPQPTFPSYNPKARIDYAFYSPNLLVHSVECVPSMASDHLPLLIHLSFAPEKNTMSQKVPL